MIPRLDPQETTAARIWLKQPAGEDVSPNGDFATRPQEDAIVLRDNRAGTETLMPTPGYHPQATAVSDDGRTVAFVGKRASDNKTALVRVHDGKSEVLDADAITTHDIDLSSDGRTVYAPSSFDVVRFDGSGRHAHAKLPAFVDRLEVLPGGRILAEGRTHGWGSSSATPAFYVLDDQGNTRLLSDIAETEALGVEVRKPLLAQYEAAYPGFSLEQRLALLDQFGYQMPTYRLMSPDHSQMAFECQPRLAPGDERQGVYVVRRGHGQAVLLTEPTDGRGLANHHMNRVEWSPRSQRLALVFTADHEPPRLTVANGDGTGFKVLPGSLAMDGTKAALAWSPDERHLAFEVRENDRTHIYAYDAKTDQVFPVVADARLVGWKDDLIRIRLASGNETGVAPLPMNTDDGFGVITGSPSRAPKTPPVPIEIKDEYIEVGGVRVPRRQESKAP